LEKQAGEEKTCFEATERQGHGGEDVGGRKTWGVRVRVRVGGSES